MEAPENTLFYGDCLRVLTQDVPPASIDLIYLDPPFNSKRDYNIPLGGKAQASVFQDTWVWSATQDEAIDYIANRDATLYQQLNWLLQFAAAGNIAAGGGLPAYLAYMAARLLACKRVLKETGSIYLHCDPTAGHYLKLLMDAVFGTRNFLNEIVWCYKSGGASPKRRFSKKHDTILMYIKNVKSYHFNPQQEKSYNRDLKPYRFAGVQEYEDEVGWYTLVGMKDYWNIDMVGRTSQERLGYPTQKPLAVDLMARRLRDRCGVDPAIRGIPYDFEQARRLAAHAPYEFERWAIRLIPGAQPNFKQSGDGGLDGRAVVAVETRPQPLFGFQVKGGQQVGRPVLDAFHGALTMNGCAAGLLVVLEERIAHRLRGHLGAQERVQLNGWSGPRIGVWSVEDWLEGRRGAPVPPLVGAGETLELLRPQTWQRVLALRSRKKQRLDAGVNGAH